MSARFSPDRRHRYVLSRALTGTQVSPDGPLTCLFIGLNPSTADEVEDDPTVRRCAGFARLWGYERVSLVNVFALRATDPRELRLVPREDAIGPDNDEHVLREAQAAELVVAAWGNGAKLARRGEYVADMLVMAGVGLQVFGLTKDGHPRHPLYLPASAEPEPWLP